MKIFSHRFSLTPKKSLNRLGSLDSREGVFLKSIINNEIGFSEYFPHPEWGDLSVDDFLKTFDLQQETVQRKAFHFLHSRFIRKETTTFLNHTLFREQNKEHFEIVKYKIKNVTDLSFLPILEKCKKMRLDANGLFDEVTWASFYERIPPYLRGRIEYIEDPLLGNDWTKVELACGRDFIPGSPFHYSIYKPYRDFISAHKNPIIFSGNMGHGLSNYQAYLELIESGDLTLHHGLVTPNLYEDLPEIFEEYENGTFRPNLLILENYLNTFDHLPWDSLCTI